MKRYSPAAVFLCVIIISGILSCGMKRAETGWVLKQCHDIPYASKSGAQKLDIYQPNEGNGPFPVIIAVHGGGFRFGDKTDNQLTPMLEGLKRGYAVVSINYRLSGEAIWPAQINDVKAAIKFVRANAAAYSLNPDLIALWGGSAGAFLCSLAGVSGNVKALEEPSLGNPSVDDRVQAVVDWFGPIDFSSMDSQWKELGIDGQKHSTPSSFESQLMGAPLLSIPTVVAASNPERYITSSAPPFFIQHGDCDTTVPFLQSVHFADKLKTAIGQRKVRFEYLKGGKHGGPGFESKENIERVLNFLDEVMKK
jgi:acetyl esterase/lipase